MGGINDSNRHGRLGNLRPSRPSRQAAEAERTVLAHPPPHGNADAIHVFPPGGMFLAAERSLCKTQRLRTGPPQPGAAAIPAVAALEIQGDLAHGRHVAGLNVQGEFPRPDRSSCTLRSIVTRSRLGLAANGKASSIAPPSFAPATATSGDALRAPFGRWRPWHPGNETHPAPPVPQRRCRVQEIRRRPRFMAIAPGESGMPSIVTGPAPGGNCRRFQKNGCHDSPSC